MELARDRSNLAWRYLLWSAAFNLGTLTALLVTAHWRGRPRPAVRAAVRPRPPRAATRAAVQGWDIAPGESLLPNGERDLVLEASLESFPASDPPAVSIPPRR